MTISIELGNQDWMTQRTNKDQGLENRKTSGLWTAPATRSLLAPKGAGRYQMYAVAVYKQCFSYAEILQPATVTTTSASKK